MHEKSKIRLEEILAEHERLRAQAAVQLEEDARRTATFMDRFERMKDSIIRPVLEETCETLAARGHEAWLEDGSTGADERIKDARVSLLVTPRRSDGLRTDSGRVMFYAERGRHRIGVNGTYRGGISTMGEYDPDEVTRDLVEDKVLEVVERVFAPLH
ncbi:MAG: hypothetical protein E6G17_07390 [Actinobacteria bacterium]|nr:MAG: hypothetical protein E6G17_07390 [Actinomycetota bacterium]